MACLLLTRNFSVLFIFWGVLAWVKMFRVCFWAWRFKFYSSTAGTDIQKLALWGDSPFSCAAVLCLAQRRFPSLLLRLRSIGQSLFPTPYVCVLGVPMMICYYCKQQAQITHVCCRIIYGMSCYYFFCVRKYKIAVTDRVKTTKLTFRSPFRFLVRNLLFFLLHLCTHVLSPHFPEFEINDFDKQYLLLS